MHNVKRHFEAEAPDFDRIILELVPYYDEMINALVAALPFETAANIRVIDLGCGTGTIAGKIKEVFPNSRITCVDLASNMIELARQKLSSFSGISYQVADFSSYDFNGRYEAVVSSLALHHLVTDEDKKGLYAKIFAALVPGGVFYNADVVLASDPHVQEVCMRQWKKYMGRSVSSQEIEEKWLLKYREEDRPAKLLDQLAWLASLGFLQVDVVWKYYNYAVYGGIKNGRS